MPWTRTATSKTTTPTRTGNGQVSWIPLDDGFHSHRKVVTAGLEAVGLHCRALSWCGASLTDGYVPAALIREFAGARAARLAQRLVDAGLWEPGNDGWHIHGWTEHNLPAHSVRARRDAANTRQRRWRQAQSAESAQSDGPEPSSAQSAKSEKSGLTATAVTPSETRHVTRDVTRDKRVTRRVSRRLPSPVPSPVPVPVPNMVESRPPLSLGDAHAGREDQELPGQTLFSAVRAARERARLDASKWHDTALASALASASKVHAERTRSELELALITIASWPDTKVPSRLRHVVEKAVREATQSNGHRRPDPLPPLPPTVAELRARGELP